MAQTPAPALEPKSYPVDDAENARTHSSSFARVAALVRRRRRFCLFTILSFNLLCVLYCIIAPNQYEASAKVALRTQPTTTLHVDSIESALPVSLLTTPLQLETLANELRSEHLAWRVITQLRLYQAPSFGHAFLGRFPGFDPQKPTAAEQNYLIDVFAKRLHVSTLPRTLLIQIRFRSHDPALASRIVNTLIQNFAAEEGEDRAVAIEAQSTWLHSQLDMLTHRVESQERELADFERQHGFMTTQESVQGGLPMETLHNAAVAEVDEAERLWLASTGDRIFRESLFREAQRGNPEQVLAANPQLQAEMGPGGAALVQQLRNHQSDVEVELAQLRAEHGPNYPRAVELAKAQAEIDGQILAADQSLVDAFERTWKAAVAREAMLRTQLDAKTAEGLKKNDATMEYTVLHEQVVSGRELCNRLRQRMEEASLASGIRASSVTVVDSAREPSKPVAPDPVIYCAISFFVSLWLAMAGAILLDAWEPTVPPQAKARLIARWKSLLVGLIVLVFALGTGFAQAPTPNTQGLPSGVVKLPEDKPATVTPDARQAPPIWNATPPQALPESGPRFAAVAMALPIAAGDLLDVSEYHLAEFRTSVRVATDGTAVLPLIGQIALAGKNEQQAAFAIEKALVDKGFLLHPQVLVLVTSAMGQDISVIGEVTRPGIYPFSVHHRLLDLIAAASGLSPNAGRLVSVFHRQDPETAHTVVLDPTGPAQPVTGTVLVTPEKPSTPPNRNPELQPGDTVMVSRAGLVYVIGDVVRPGGFAVDPVQGLTVVQAVSLAWGATTNAAASKAILIHDQSGGRTLTTLNLRRMIRGQDPDLPIHDRDILFIPNSTAKNLMNKSLEAAIQSAIGVSIYAGLVYSQRF